MSEEDKYIEKNVHPILEKLGESLAAVMPQDLDQFVLEWLEAGLKIPEGRSAKSAAVDSRKKYVQDKISPMLWQITYDCLTARPKDVTNFLIERIKKRVLIFIFPKAFGCIKAGSLLTPDHEN